MALDGAFLRHIKFELEDTLIGARVDKVHQPNRSELVLAFRSRAGASKLLLSARANSARVSLISESLENPKQPPMLCMLLRKKLQGAKLMEITQPGLERVLQFHFDSINELGDHTDLILSVEIMGKYSNIVLVDATGHIVDAIKRVDAEMSSQRLVLPGLTYALPPPQDKLSMLDTEPSVLISAIKGLTGNMRLAKALLSLLQGVSPVVCREIEHKVGRGAEITIQEMTENQEFRLKFFYQTLREQVTNHTGTPNMVVDMQKKPIDFSFFELHQYGVSATSRKLERFSDMLEKFYFEKDFQERLRVREQDLLRLLSNVSERLSRKIVAQQTELTQCADRDQQKVFGDLVSANLYVIEKGTTHVMLNNFYEEGQPQVDVQLDPLKTPAQNAQKYYKEYHKAKTAEEKLTEQIKIAEDELIYINSVFDTLTRVEKEQDLLEIRAELAHEGYLKRPKAKAKKQAISKPAHYTVSDGFSVLVGRNNQQNDMLTLKIANKNDIWFHTKEIPGSHTVLVTDGKEPTEKAMEDAATLAAQHSKAKDSTKVPVDYTKIRHVTKPQGAKPGRVIYVNYKTMFVTPTDGQIGVERVKM